MLLALSRPVGSEAGALHFAKPMGSIPKKQQEVVCLANIRRPNGQCLIPRGGSTAAAQASDPQTLSETLKILGVTGIMVYFRDTVASAVGEWWKTAETTKFLIAGAVAGIVSRTAVSPLEVVATAQMVRGGRITADGMLLPRCRPRRTRRRVCA